MRAFNHTWAIDTGDLLPRYNKLNCKKAQLFWLTFKDKVLIVLYMWTYVSLSCYDFAKFMTDTKGKFN